MFKKALLVAALLTAAISLSLFAEGQPSAPPSSTDSDAALQQKIDALIKQLGSDSYFEREAAQEELKKIGWDARESLKEAAKSDDLEVATRAKTLLEEIGPVNMTLVCVDDAGKPLENKKISVQVDYSGTYDADGEYKQPESDNKEGQTDGNGAFNLGALKSAIFNFKAQVEGYSRTGADTTVTYQDGKHVMHLRFMMPGTVKGVVVDADNGDKPIAGAYVHYNSGEVSSRTDEMGQFELKGIAPGERYITVVTQRNDNDGNRIGSRETFHGVFVRPNATAVMVVKCAGVGQWVAPSLKCSLRAPDGKPIPNTGVVPSAIAIDSDNQRDVFEGYSYGSFGTDKNGCAKISLPQIGKYRMALYVAGYEPIDLGEHEFKAGEEWEIRDPIMLKAGQKMSFTVKDADGNPASNALVVVWHPKMGYLRSTRAYECYERALKVSESFASETKPLIPWGQAVTDSRGSAEIGGLEEGETLAEVLCKDYAPSEIKTVVLKQGEQGEPLAFTLVKRAHVAILVKDADTNAIIPWTEAKVIIEKNSQIGSAYYRRFENPADGVAPGKHYIVARAPGYMSGYVVGDFAPGENPPVTLRLKKLRKGSISGKVEPSKSIPLSKVNYARIYPTRNTYREMVIRVNDDGTFAVPYLYEGTWEVEFFDIGDNVIGRKTFTVVKDKTVDVQVRLREAGSLRVAFPDATDKDLQEGWIWIASSDVWGGYGGIFWQGYHYFVFEVDNRSLVRPLAEGTYIVQANVIEDGKWQSRGTVLIVKAGQVTDAKILLHSKVTLKIRGIPSSKSGWSLILMPEMESESNWSSRQVRPLSMSAEPTVELRVTPGKYRVCAQGADRFTLVNRIEIGENDTTKEVELRLPERVQKFSGRVRDFPCERTYDGSTVRLEGDSIAFAHINPDGTFEVAAPPGKYRIFLSRDIQMYLTDEEKNGLKEITIEEGEDLTGIELQ